MNETIEVTCKNCPFREAAFQYVNGIGVVHYFLCLNPGSEHFFFKSASPAQQFIAAACMPLFDPSLGEALPDGADYTCKICQTAFRLKPCPFCGGEAKLLDGWPHHVACTKCTARVTSLKTDPDGILEAVELWNRRD